MNYFTKDLKIVKQANEDFEFYPTTNKILKCLIKHLQTDTKIKREFSLSLLDIGAGNCKTLNKLKKVKWEKKDCSGRRRNYFNSFYGIEKSRVLTDSWDKDIKFLGTDFNNCSLIDKKIDTVFCNPPYSVYANWTQKIIKEANCKFIYMVIPKRWRKNKAIKSAIKQRGVNYSVIDSFDFLDSEDRKARARVDLVFMSINTDAAGPFSLWFDEVFSLNDKKNKDTNLSDYDKKKKIKKEIKKQQLVNGDNLIKTLESLYNKELNKLIENYKLICNLDTSIFNELELVFRKLKSNLESKIEGLKYRYWNELFNNLDKITDRLTSEYRKLILNTMFSKTNIDFNAQNAYSIIVWVLKNANPYLDKQLLSLYEQIACATNIKNYKSNKILVKDGYRYEFDGHSHFKLEYRLVHSMHSAAIEFENRWGDGNDIGLSGCAIDFINDCITIATNLGFKVQDDARDYSWKRGQEETLYCFEPNGEYTVFAKMRPYLNGNLHIKFNKKFMLKFNVEAGRLNKWLKTPAEAAQELNENINDIIPMFNDNYSFLIDPQKLLTGD